jgi:hypothetical protein
MHFEGPTASWLQSVNHRILSATWTELCSWIHDRFGRDQHESLIRQLFHIKQLTSVQDYIDKFVELVDQLIAYEPASDQRYCNACFVDGLKDDIKSVILIQCPVDLVTACTLALLQEEADIARRREYRRPNSHFKSCTQGVPVPLPLPPPPKTDKPAVAGQHSIIGHLMVPGFQLLMIRLLHYVPITELVDYASSVLKSGLVATNVLHQYHCRLCRSSGKCCGWV